MRTPNATEHNPSYDNEFLPVRPCVAGRRKSQIGVGWRATVDEMGNIRSPSRYDAGASCALQSAILRRSAISHYGSTAGLPASRTR